MSYLLEVFLQNPFTIFLFWILAFISIIGLSLELRKRFELDAATSLLATSLLIINILYWGAYLNFHLIQIEGGKAIFQGAPSQSHLNPMGTTHGGWFAAILDSAMGCAVHSKMPVGRAYTTAELSINLVKAITPQVKRLRAIGHVVHCGKQLATTEGRLVGPDGTLYAHATSTCLVFDLKPSAKA